MRAGFLEVGLALGVEQTRRGIGEQALRIGRGFVTLCFNEDRSARPEPTESVIETASHRDQRSSNGGVQIRPS